MAHETLASHRSEVEVVAKPATEGVPEVVRRLLAAEEP